MLYTYINGSVKGDDMPRGVPKAGFRMTRKRKAAGGKRGQRAQMNVVTPTYQEPVTNETDDEIRNKLDERFAAMGLMVRSACSGDVRAVVISGPAGVGKSHEVDEVLKLMKPYHTVIHGYVRPTGLYKTLYEYRHPGSVVVFDDADSIFGDDISLNLLKTACDTTRQRTLSWLSETRMMDEDGADKMPRQFDFDGTVVFITNMDFDFLIERGNKLAPHFQALVSRSMYLDMAMKTKRDYMIRIKQVIEQGMLRKQFKFSKSEEEEVLNFVDTNQDKVRELSLRMVVKIASLKKAHPTKWQTLAKVVCCRG